MAADRDETGFLQTATLHRGPFSRLTLHVQSSRASGAQEKISRRIEGGDCDIKLA